MPPDSNTTPTTEKVTLPNVEQPLPTVFKDALSRVRPEWSCKTLVMRVRRLLLVDPSSACQRLFNASIHDMKEKIVIAGLDIAQAAAEQYKLPPLTKAEDVEDYSVLNTIDLSYRMGLLSRPEWRRFRRVYDIRRDLEHEDDEYEAQLEDCVYIFRTCIDVVLSKDPVQLLKLTEIKEIVENASPATLTDAVLEEFKHAPEPRQTEIYRFLISTALNVEKPDIVRQNCYNMLSFMSKLVRRNVLFSEAREMVERIRLRVPELAEMRIALAAGILPYLKKAQLRGFFERYLRLMNETSFHWTEHSCHEELLRDLEEVGGLNHCPDELLDKFLEWLVLCFIGEPGGYGFMGSSRKVFYSNVGAPAALRIMRDAEVERISSLRESSNLVKDACENEYVARRFEKILDVAG